MARERNDIFMADCIMNERIRKISGHFKLNFLIHIVNIRQPGYMAYTNSCADGVEESATGHNL
ncbi:Allantoicase [Trichinella pseudospiralis]